MNPTLYPTELSRHVLKATAKVQSIPQLTKFCLKKVTLSIQNGLKDGLFEAVFSLLS